MKLIDQLHILVRIIISGSVALSQFHTFTVTEMCLFLPTYSLPRVESKIPKDGIYERLAAGVAAMQHSLSVCSVKDSSFGSFLSDLVFVGINSEGGCVGRGEGVNET